MRRCGIVPDENAARRLADFLLAQQIRTRCDIAPGGVEVWVLDEDRLAEARAACEAFLAAPHDPRFSAATGAAEVARREERRRERDFQKNYVPVAKTWRQPAGPTPLTWFLLAACFVTAALTRLGREPEPQRVMNALRITPLVFWEVDDRFASFATSLAEVRRGEVWRLWTPMFIHFGLIHLLFNTLMLHRLALAIEIRRGTWRLGLLVLATGLAAHLGQWEWGFLGHRWAPDYVSRPSPNFGGMSGVLYGLFGYVWMKSRYAPQLGLFIDQDTVVLLIGWLFLCMTGLVFENVANAAHAGGLLSGMAIGYLPESRLVRTLRGRFRRKG